ncbi:glycosyltransferase [Georgenia sp. TF02-10]|uniref:glycosyltransferase family 2 protein n=1 Tax=Georgenia sp. TF02-10 TaxID=2917725 RepID=UPI001FA807BE|nr:glycosyltransferase [Georgenia sp. TF02-10]UNX54795.1 glycosyltransferase [Georgenia sp. TF02-10]
MSAAAPPVTVVVAGRDRRAELLATLDRQPAPVIYVDNASTDGSAAAVRGACPAVTVVHLRRDAGAYARTLGVRRAGSEYVALADADSWWPARSLAAAARALDAAPRLAVVAARILGPDGRPDPACAPLAASPLPPVDGAPGLLGFVAGAAVVRRSAFLAAGGFDPVVGSPGEEERLAWDLAEQGWHLAYRDDVVVHRQPRARRHLAAQRRRQVARAAVLTGFMRLPWPAATARLQRAWHGEPPERAGAADAVRELPAALRRRRVLSAEVLAWLVRLGEVDPDDVAEAAPTGAPTGGRTAGGRPPSAPSVRRPAPLAAGAAGRPRR